tara:strand:- start:728 stop:970 length:243 start_codon:yes stop_codon:yes gene_type:complete
MHSLYPFLIVEKSLKLTVYPQFSWVPDVFPGQGAATLWFADFTKHPAYQAIVDVLKKYIKANEDDDHHHGGKGKWHHWRS